MTEKTTTKEYTLDATGQKLGRLATKVALLLRGKTQASFERHIMPDVKVTITNASKIDLSAKKMGEEYKRFTGYPGGLKTEKRGHLIGRKGYKDVFTNTVYGMLPGNRLRKQIMKNLIINE